VKGRYAAVVFDLFNTLVRWSPDRLPRMELRGRDVPSTLPILFPILERALGESFERERFVEVYLSVLKEIDAERDVEWTEVTCRERFERSLRRLDASSNAIGGVAEELTRSHMGMVRSVTAAPPEWITAVRSVARAYRTGVLSNFDDSQTGREIVADTGLEPLFDVVVFSADVGLRKPNPRLFRHVLERLRLLPAEVLYVGDTPLEDVAGARSVGMSVVWVSGGKGPFPAGVPEPDFAVPDVTSLPDLLGVG